MLKQMLVSTILIGSAFTGSLTAFGSEYGTTAEAKAMLDRAVVAIKADKVDAIKMFNYNDPRFRDRDLFVFCFNASDGKFTAHEAFVGQNARLLQDSTGRWIGEEFYQDAREDEIAEIPFVYPQPGSTKLASKIAFVTWVRDQICGVSAYRSSGENLQSNASPFQPTSTAKLNRGTPMPPEFDWSVDEPVIREQIIAGMAALRPGETPTPSVLTSIVTWISNAVDLPADYNLPTIERVPNIKLAAVFHGSQFVSPGRSLGVYDDDKAAILLPSDWTGSRPAELSILVHEMVHHLQNVAGMQFQCPQEREKLAYVAQERWLAASGRTLETSFGIDPETFMFNTECYIP